MVYYKIPIIDGVFDYPAGCILLGAYSNCEFMYCEFYSVCEVLPSWISITEETYKNGCPKPEPLPPDPDEDNGGNGGSGDYIPDEDTVPSLEIPAIYDAAVRKCMEDYYHGDFDHVMIMEWYGSNESYICVLFLTEDFEILSYDPYTSEFTAIGWFSCVLTESTGEWTTVDYRTQASTGGNYAMNIEYSSRYIEFNGQTLYPVPVMTEIEVTDLDFDDEAGTLTVTLATGYSETYTYVYDDNGEVIGFTDSRGHSFTIGGL